MRTKHVLLVLALVMAIGSVASAQIITSAVRANGSSNDRTPIGVYDGNTQPLPTQEGGLKLGNHTFSDRDYLWGETPAELIGAEYVRTFNNDKGASGVTYTVTTSQIAQLWVTMDDRFGSQQSAVDAVVEAFAEPGTFTDTGLNLIIEEGGGRPISVYSATLEAGTYVFGNQDNSNNFYTLGALPPDYSPQVNAGEDVRAHIGEEFQLEGSVTDLTPEGEDPEVLTYMWSAVDETAPITITNAGTLTPTVVIDANGIHELILQVSDGTNDSNDVLLVEMRYREDELMVGRWNLENNFEDISDNSNDGTAIGEVPFLDDARIGDFNIELVNDGSGEPNFVHLGPAPELDFVNEFSVTAWVKTTSDEQMNVFNKGGDGGGGHRYILSVGETGGPRGRAELVVDDNSSKRNLQSTTQVNDGLWHFIAVTSDGETARVYVDGKLEGSTSLPDNYDLSGTSQKDAYIGAGIQQSATDAMDVQKTFDGSIDDVRVYNYPLPLTDLPEYDSITSLVLEGPLSPAVSIEDVASPVEYQYGVEIPLVGVVEEKGTPNVTPLTYWWSTISGPLVNEVMAEAIFTSPTELETGAEFTAFGTYTLSLTVTDADSNEQVIAEVTLELLSPTCEDVAEAGLLKAADINEDCRVDLADFALLAEEWASCNDPSDPLCVWPF